MKFNKKIAQAELADIEMYSLPATDQNLQNVAKLFERGITPAPAIRKNRVRPLRVVLAAAISVVMAFSVALVASAELREAVLETFEVVFRVGNADITITESRNGELIPVTATNGIEGFIYSSSASATITLVDLEPICDECYGDDTPCLEDLTEEIMVSVYDADGETVIGEYEIKIVVSHYHN